MGDPKKSRKKYSRPLRPWEGERIKEENEQAAMAGADELKALSKAWNQSGR